MKKNKFSEFFKGKGYYVLLFVGVIAIAAVALIGSQLSSKQNNEEKKIVDLNETDNNIAAGDNSNKVAENNPVSDGVVNNTDNTSKGTVAKDKTGQDVAKNDAELEDFSDKGNNTEQAKAAETETAKTDAVETAGGTVQADNSAAIAALSFKSDDELAWPVQGNVIMNYSMDHTTYFATLMQYQVNPAIIIDAEVGAEVKAATDGIVTAIDADNEETGYTITMSIGNGYSLVYGQLDKDSVSLKVGSKVKEGDVIGKIDEPTNYYVVEGSNLFFEVMKDDEPVNPMLFLH